MDRQEFEEVFKIGQVVAAGGSRRQLRIHEISDEWFSVIAVSGKLQKTQRIYFDKLDAVISGFGQINPKRIEKTVQSVLISRGLKKETKTETYLYGFARAYVQAIENAAQVGADDLPDDLTDPALYLEGAKNTIVVNAYKRKLAARTKCLEKYGTCCSVCNVDLGAIYGEIGEGYIHVHHLNPIAARGGTYLLDPIKDLRPVCPNCHAMLHRRNPPLSPEELREAMGL